MFLALCLNVYWLYIILQNGSNISIKKLATTVRYDQDWGLESNKCVWMLFVSSWEPTFLIQSQLIFGQNAPNASNLGAQNGSMLHHL